MQGEGGCFDGRALRVELAARRHDHQAGHEGRSKVDGSKGQKLRGGAEEWYWFTIVHDGDDLADGIKPFSAVGVLLKPGWEGSV